MSYYLQAGLFVAYIIIMGVSIYEKKNATALYWFAAAVLLVSVIWMQRGGK